MQRVVGQRRQLPVHSHEVTHPGNLGADDDAVVTEPHVLGEGRRPDTALHHRVEQHLSGVQRVGAHRVLVHELREETLVQRSPVDADADWLAVVDGEFDNLPEILVAPLRAHVARVYAVFGEIASTLGVFLEEDVPVVVEVADDRRLDALVPEARHDLGHGPSGRVVVHGYPHELATGSRGARQLASPSRRCRPCPCSSSTGRPPDYGLRRSLHQRRPPRWVCAAKRSSIRCGLGACAKGQNLVVWRRSPVETGCEARSATPRPGSCPRGGAAPAPDRTSVQE